MHPHERVLMNASAKDLATYIPIGLPSSLYWGALRPRGRPWTFPRRRAARLHRYGCRGIYSPYSPLLQPAEDDRRAGCVLDRLGSSPGCAPGLDPDGEIRELRAVLGRVS